MNGPAAPARRRFLGAAALAGGAALLPRCAPRPAAARGVVRYPFPVDPVPLDFARATDATAMLLAHVVSDTLVGIGTDLEPRPGVARSWTWSEDRTALTFRLDPAARWHDGRPVVPADVVATFERITDPATGAPDRAAALNTIAAVEPDGPDAVRVRYRSPFAPALSSWALLAHLVPAHVREPGPLPVGCGPFRVVAHTAGQRILTEAFAEYHGGPPRCAGVEFEILRDFGTRFAALRAGQLEISALLPQQFEEYERDAELRERFRIETFRPLYLQHVAWRMDGSNPFFADVRVRRAMTLAIDRAAYVRTLMAGAGEAAVTSFHPDLWVDTKHLPPLPHDPAAAGALLDAAGFTRAGAAAVRARDGVRLSFRLTYPQGTAETERIAAFIAAQLREVGVEVRLEPLEWAVCQARMRERAFEALLAFRSLPLDPDPFDLWHSASAAGGMNYTGLRDPEVDRAIEAGRSTLDRAERGAHYRRVAERLHELQPSTFLAWPLSRFAVSRALDGVTSCALGLLAPSPGIAAWRFR